MWQSLVTVERGSQRRNIEQLSLSEFTCCVYVCWRYCRNGCSRGTGICALQLHVAKHTARTGPHRFSNRSTPTCMHHAMQGWSQKPLQHTHAAHDNTSADMAATHTDCEIISLYTSIHTPTLPSYLALYVCVCVYVASVAKC
jgi:hypothetical protein